MAKKNDVLQVGDEVEVMLTCTIEGLKPDEIKLRTRYDRIVFMDRLGGEAEWCLPIQADAASEDDLGVWRLPVELVKGGAIKKNHVLRVGDNVTVTLT
jgi:hypothetical protein